MRELTNKQLQAWVKNFAKEVARNGEEINQVAVAISDAANATRADANSIGAKKVDPDTVSETGELAKIMDGLSEASLAYAAAATDTSRAADQVDFTARTTHDAIDEAVNRSPARGIHDVSRDWFEQQ